MWILYALIMKIKLLVPYFMYPLTRNIATTLLHEFILVIKNLNSLTMTKIELRFG